MTKFEDSDVRPLLLRKYRPTAIQVLRQQALVRQRRSPSRWLIQPYQKTRMNLLVAALLGTYGGLASFTLRW